MKHIFYLLLFFSSFVEVYARALPQGFFPHPHLPNTWVWRDQGIQILLHPSGWTVQTQGLTPDSTLLSESFEVSLLNAQPFEFIPADYAKSVFQVYETSQSYRFTPCQQLTLVSPWPGIDILWTSKNGKLKYDFRLAPGANPDLIQLAYSKGKLSFAPQTLNLTLPSGQWTESLGKVFTQRNQVESLVRAEFQQKKSSLENNSIVNNHNISGNYNIVGYNIESYNIFDTLWIDPGVLWSSYWGSPDVEVLSSLKVLPDGSRIACGYSNGLLYPVANAQQGTLAGSLDAVVFKIDAHNQLIWSTYWGGVGYDRAQQLAVNPQGDIAVTGETNDQMPVTPGCPQPLPAGGFDAFLSTFNANGQLSWSTHWGGTQDDFGYAIVWDNIQQRWVLAGGTASADLPVSGGFQPVKAGSNFSSDAFVTIFTISGNPGWGTFWGGEQAEYAYAIDVDYLGRIVLGGYTTSTYFPTTNAWQSGLGGNADLFLTQLDTYGQPIWSTYAGGVNVEVGSTLITDPMGNILMAGYADGAGFPTQGGAQLPYGGNEDALLLKWNTIGQLQWASYWGGVDNDRATSISLDTAGNSFVVGYTEGNSMPVVNASQPQSNGMSDAWYGSFSSQGAPVWVSYLGGSQSDYAYAAATDAAGHYYLGGISSSLDFPTTPGSLQPNNATITPVSPTIDMFITTLCISHANLSGNAVICSGTANLSVQLTGVGPWDVVFSDGTNPITVGITTSNYLWQVTPTATTTYSLISVTDLGACGIGAVSGTGIVQVVNTPPSATISGQTTLCPGSLANIQFQFTSLPPWSVIFTDGTVQDTLTNINQTPYYYPVSPTVSTTWQLVSMTSACGTGGVSGMATFTLDNVALPTAIGSLSVTKCAGDTVQLPVYLTGAQPWEIQYTDGVQNYTVTGITASPYMISATLTIPATWSLISVQNACGNGTVQGSFFFYILDQPLAIGTVAQDTQLFVPFVRTTNGSLHTQQWIWVWGDGLRDTAFQPTHTYLAYGTYTVSLIATGLCGSDTLTMQVVLDFDTIRSTDPIYEEDLLPYPNPLTSLDNRLFIPGLQNPEGLEVYSVLGVYLAPLNAIEPSKGEYSFPSDLPSGIYWIKVSNYKGFRIVWRP